MTSNIRQTAHHIISAGFCADIFADSSSAEMSVNLHF